MCYRSIPLLAITIAGLVALPGISSAWESFSDVLEGVKASQQTLLGSPLTIRYGVECRPAPVSEHRTIGPDSEGFTHEIITTYTPDSPIDESVLSSEYVYTRASEDWWFIEREGTKARWDGESFVMNHSSPDPQVISSTFIKPTPDLFMIPLNYPYLIDQVSPDEITDFSVEKVGTALHIVVSAEKEIKQGKLNLNFRIVPGKSFCVVEHTARYPNGYIVTLKCDEFFEVEPGLSFPGVIVQETADNDGKIVRSTTFTIHSIERLQRFDPQEYLITPKLPTIVFNQILNSSYMVSETEDPIGPW